MPTSADDEALEARLRATSWRRADDELVRDVEFADFGGAMRWVNRVAVLAEAADHHPDILVHGYRRVRLRLSDHAAGRVTAKDAALAEAIDALDPAPGACAPPA